MTAGSICLGKCGTFYASLDLMMNIAFQGSQIGMKTNLELSKVESIREL